MTSRSKLTANICCSTKCEFKCQVIMQVCGTYRKHKTFTDTINSYHKNNVNCFRIIIEQRNVVFITFVYLLLHHNVSAICQLNVLE